MPLVSLISGNGMSTDYYQNLSELTLTSEISVDPHFLSTKSKL